MLLVLLLSAVVCVNVMMFAVVMVRVIMCGLRVVVLAAVFSRPLFHGWAKWCARAGAGAAAYLGSAPV